MCNMHITNVQVRSGTHIMVLVPRPLAQLGLIRVSRQRALAARLHIEHTHCNDSIFD